MHAITYINYPPIYIRIFQYDNFAPALRMDDHKQKQFKGTSKFNTSILVNIYTMYTDIT